jgi:hypothetical protein
MKSKRQDLRPDKYRLDEEWEEQADLMNEAAEAAARAKAAFKTAEAETERVKAEVSLRIRKDPKAYGFEKVTEELVKTLAVVQPEYRAAVADEIEKQRRADEAIGKVHALQGRKQALEDLRFLFSIDYFARPKELAAKGVASREYDRKRDRGVASIGKKAPDRSDD